jgi:hypothetical protein
VAPRLSDEPAPGLAASAKAAVRGETVFTAGGCVARTGRPRAQRLSRTGRDRPGGVSRTRLFVPPKPVEDRLQRLAVVAFHHYQVPVAVHAVGGEAHVLHVSASALQERHSVRVAKAEERRLAGDDRDRHALKVDQLVLRIGAASLGGI